MPTCFMLIVTIVVKSRLSSDSSLTCPVVASSKTCTRLLYPGRDVDRAPLSIKHAIDARARLLVSTFLNPARSARALHRHHIPNASQIPSRLRRPLHLAVPSTFRYLTRAAATVVRSSRANGPSKVGTTEVEGRRTLLARKEVVLAEKHLFPK